MIIQNPYNRKIQEYFKLEDIQEDRIQLNKLNATPLESYLAHINKGTKRRINNRHEQRLARFKQNT